MTDLGQILEDACNSVINNPNLIPIKDLETGAIVKTFCNLGALEVAQAMSCHEFDTIDLSNPMTADELVWMMRSNLSGKWKKVTGSQAAIHALSGGLAFAGMTSGELGEAHGHIAAIYPASMQHSGSLARDVPMVANVGTCLREEKSSDAFPVSRGEAEYFAWNLESQC